MIPELTSQWPVEWHDEVTSTQASAQQKVRDGDFGPVWIAARSQSHGRGRRGRRWRSEPGNLHATALFPPDARVEAPYIGMSAVLATLDVVRYDGSAGLVYRAGVEPPRLKWPNDIMIGDSKLAGVLVETGTYDNRPWAAAGIGINILLAPVADQPTVALSGICQGPPPGAEDVLAVLASAFARRLRRLAEGGPEAVSADWREVADACDRTLARCS